MSREAASCPSDARLKAFSIGDLSLEELEAIAEHVRSCALCDAALEDTEREGDELVAGLRGVGGEFTVDAGLKLSSALGAGPVRIDRFELLEELGHGTFGYVFRARDVELDRIVAIKVQRGGYPEQDHGRFVREARSVAALEHPRIVSIFETGCTAEGAPYLVTELVEGETLAQRLHGRPVDPVEAAQCVADVAEALEYAHRRGVIHRDLKPSNILIDRDGGPHVLDFGLAKLETGGTTLTPRGEAVGTPAYMSPEQARGAHDVDARTDVYSMGVVLYELLTGSPPFQGNRRMLMLQVLEDEPRPPRQLVDRLPRDVETICLKALSKSPGARYATAGELAADLRRFVAGEQIHARPLTRLGTLRHWCARNPLPAGVVGAVIVGSVAGWVYLTRLTGALVRGAAVHSAELQAEVLEEVNAFYSELVEGLEGADVSVTHEYESSPHALPLPATFTIAAGERISRSASGMQVRLYSDFPFPWRTDGGPRDDFERRALAALRAGPALPFWEIGEVEGREVLRYAKARLMEQSCLSCHNFHPETPKDDWRVGDVRGVLEIIRPVDTDDASTRQGLRGAFALAVATTAVLIGLAAAVLFVTNRRRSARDQRSPARAR